MPQLCLKPQERPMAAFTGFRTPMKSGIAATIASPSRYDHALGARRRSPDWIIWPALAIALATGIALAAGPARPQAGVTLVKIDLSVVGQGYRMSKVIGSSVIN